MTNTIDHQEDDDECPTCGRSDRQLLVVGPGGMPHAGTQLSIVSEEGFRLAWSLAGAAGDEAAIEAITAGLQYGPDSDPEMYGLIAQAAVFTLAADVLPKFFHALNARQRRRVQDDIRAQAELLDAHHTVNRTTPEQEI